MQPVPSLQDDIFTVKNRKNTCQGRNLRSVIFYNFFFQIDAKFDAEFNGTGPESRKWQLYAQNWKKPAGRVEKLELFFFEIFFLNQCKIWCWFQWNISWVEKTTTSPRNPWKKGLGGSKNLKLLYLKIFFSNRCKILRWFQIYMSWVTKSTTYCWKLK